MEQAVFTRGGRLTKKFLPAMYLDASVLVYYWLVEGTETTSAESESPKPLELPHLQIVRDIMRSEGITAKVVEIRRRLIRGAKVTGVVSPLSLLELMEWHAESAFKQAASEAAGAMFIQRRSKKEIGDYLSKAIDLRLQEKKLQKGKRRAPSTGLGTLMYETWMNRSFTEAHGLSGLVRADISNFNLSVARAWQEPSAYAYLQLGTADIMHILLAQQFGCKYIASFDSDFKRVKDIVTEETGMRVLVSPDEILSVL